MIPKSTNHYFIFPSELEGDRADFVFHHPWFEPIREFRRSAPITLGYLITPPEHGLSFSGKEEGAVGFLNTQHITPNGEIIFDPQTFIEGCPEEALLREGDILIARTGFTLGKAACIREEYSGFAFGSFCLRFRPLPDVNYGPEFVVRFLNSRTGQAQILMLRTGSDKPNINADQIRDIRLPRIALNLQDKANKIARKIEGEAIKLRGAANDIRASAEDTMLLELSLKVPPPGTLNYSFKSGSKNRTTWFATFPEDVADRLNYSFFYSPHHLLDAFRSSYATTTLAEICGAPITRGEQPVYDGAGEVLALKTVDMKNGYINYEQALRVSHRFFDAHPQAHARKGNILLSSTGFGSVGKVDVYDRDSPAIVDSHISIIRVNNKYDPNFVAYFLRSALGQLQVEKWITGSSGQLELQPNDLGRFIVPVGIDLGKQHRISEAITKRLSKARQMELCADAKWQEAKIKFEEAILPSIWEKSDEDIVMPSSTKQADQSIQELLFD